MRNGKFPMPKEIRNSNSEARDFVVPVGQRQLFLDDVGIACIENLTHTMHRPVKKGAVIRPDPRRGIGSHEARSAPYWDEEAALFRFWVHGAPDGLNACSYFESPDGLHWSKPALSQMQHHGSRDNNYVCVQGMNQNGVCKISRVRSCH